MEYPDLMPWDLMTANDRVYGMKELKRWFWIKFKAMLIFLGIGLIFSLMWTNHLQAYHRVCKDGNYQCVVTNK